MYLRVLAEYKAMVALTTLIQMFLHSMDFFTGLEGLTEKKVLFLNSIWENE